MGRLNLAADFRLLPNFQANKRPSGIEWFLAPLRPPDFHWNRVRTQLWPWESIFFFFRKAIKGSPLLLPSFTKTTKKRLKTGVRRCPTNPQKYLFTPCILKKVCSWASIEFFGSVNTRFRLSLSRLVNGTLIGNLPT